MTRTAQRLAVIAAACLVLAVPGVAGAEQTPPPATDDSRPYLELACARIPNLQRRTANLLERLPADEDTRGSIAWVQARADEARADGREELADALDDRATVLTEKLDVLPLRQERLAELEQHCADELSA